MKVVLRRGTDTAFLKRNKIIKKNELVCILDDDKDIDNYEKLEDKKVKYKIGDGKHRYSELPIQPGIIPVILELDDSNRKTLFELIGGNKHVKGAKMVHDFNKS